MKGPSFRDESYAVSSIHNLRNKKFTGVQPAPTIADVAVEVLKNETDKALAELMTSERFQPQYRNISSVLTVETDVKSTLIPIEVHQAVETKLSNAVAHVEELQQGRAADAQRILNLEGQLQCITAKLGECQKVCAEQAETIASLQQREEQNRGELELTKKDVERLGALQHSMTAEVARLRQALDARTSELQNLRELSEGTMRNVIAQAERERTALTGNFVAVRSSLAAEAELMHNEAKRQEEALRSAYKAMVERAVRAETTLAMHMCDRLPTHDVGVQSDGCSSTAYRAVSFISAVPFSRNRASSEVVPDSAAAMRASLQDALSSLALPEQQQLADVACSLVRDLEDDLDQHPDLAEDAKRVLISSHASMVQKMAIHMADRSGESREEEQGCDSHQTESRSKPASVAEDTSAPEWTASAAPPLAQEREHKTNPPGRKSRPSKAARHRHPSTGSQDANTGKRMHRVVQTARRTTSAFVGMPLAVSSNRSVPSHDSSSGPQEQGKDIGENGKSTDAAFTAVHRIVEEEIPEELDGPHHTTTGGRAVNVEQHHTIPEEIPEGPNSPTPPHLRNDHLPPLSNLLHRPAPRPPKLPIKHSHSRRR
eukprot:Sspe_Gene.27474::Locus_11872_Transcript_1_1_Confidence_1.000_Length_1928::g.27474::m.27474